MQNYLLAHGMVFMKMQLFVYQRVVFFENVSRKNTFFRDIKNASI